MNIIETLKDLVATKFTLVYAPEKSESGQTHQIYLIDNPNKAERLLNKGSHVGFITVAHNRGENQIRSFRFDRIVSLSKV